MKKVIKHLVPIFLGCLFLPLPLLGDFHFESAMLAAIVGCFWGGIASSKIILKKERRLIFKILTAVYLFGFPIFLFSLFRGCFTLHGLGFWVLVPAPSVLLGVTIGRLFRKLIVPLPTTLTFLTLLFISVGVLLVEVLTLPQVYFFNHVWGAWPGPIYDETVTIGWNLILFRVITIAWIVFLWFLPDWKKSGRVKLTLALAVLILFPSYLFLPESGVITPRSELKQQLKKYQSEHFDIYYADTYFSDTEIEYWALKHEFYFEEINNQLEIDWPEDRKIESYIYSNAWQKKALVGAKFTSYVPIWLNQDQLHIAKEHLDDVLMHEMVHVISKQFGNKLFNGSWSIGLIEGLAEGIAKDASPESTLDQIMAADPPYPTAEQMEAALSFKGFYSSAGAISYTTAGSFVSYLLDEYPVSDFKEAYATNDFEAAYSIPFDQLVSEWQNSLPEVVLDSLDQQNSAFIFSQRSIFQKACPHAVSPLMEQWDQIRLHETNRQLGRALPIVEGLYTSYSYNSVIKLKWLQYQLRFGNYEKVIEAVQPNDSIPQFRLIKSDAHALLGDWESAYSEMNQTISILPNPLPRNFKYSYELRSDSLNWEAFINNRYKDIIPQELTTQLNSSNKYLSISKAIDIIQSERIPAFASAISTSDLNSDWFDIYIQLIDQLIFLESYEIAQNWIEAVSELNLRPRYIERLEEQQEWLEFVMKVES